MFIRPIMGLSYDKKYKQSSVNNSSNPVFTGGAAKRGLKTAAARFSEEYRGVDRNLIGRFDKLQKNTPQNTQKASSGTVTKAPEAVNPISVEKVLNGYKEWTRLETNSLTGVKKLYQVSLSGFGPNYAEVKIIQPDGSHEIFHYRDMGRGFSGEEMLEKGEAGDYLHSLSSKETYNTDRQFTSKTYYKNIGFRQEQTDKYGKPFIKYFEDIHVRSHTITYDKYNEPLTRIDYKPEIEILDGSGKIVKEEDTLLPSSWKEADKVMANLEKSSVNPDSNEIKETNGYSEYMKKMHGNTDDFDDE